MEMLLFIIPFFLKYLRKQIHTIPIIKFLCMNMQISFSPFPREILHFDSSLLPLYAPLLENSIITLMAYDEIKSFSFLSTFSLSELYFHIPDFP